MQRVPTRTATLPAADVDVDVAIIGMGTIGLELGQSLAKVSGFDQIQRIAGIADPEVNHCAIEPCPPKRSAAAHCHTSTPRPRRTPPIPIPARTNP